jgi:hypothetical protein
MKGTTMTGTKARAIIADAHSEDAVRALEIAQDFFGVASRPKIQLDGTVLVTVQGVRCLLKAESLCGFARCLCTSMDR